MRALRARGRREACDPNDEVELRLCPFGVGSRRTHIRLRRRSIVMTQLAVLVVVLLGCCVVGNAQIPQTSPAQAGESTECTQIKVTVTRLEAWLRDWPDLGRYRDQNGQVKAPVKNEKRVAFMGDSITDSWDEPRYGAFFQAEPYVNRGIGGQTTQQMLIRFRPDVIALKPQVVVILAGTNDIAGNTGPTTLKAIQDNLTSMVELARVHKIR